MSDYAPRKVHGQKAYYQEWDVPLFNGHTLVACWGEEGWIRFNKDIGNPYPTSAGDLFGVSMHMTKGSYSKTVIFIDIRAHHEDVASPMYHLLTTLAHEVSHFCDHVFDHIGEKNPCTETRAYLSEWAYGKLFMFHMRRGDWPMAKTPPKAMRSKAKRKK